MLDFQFNTYILYTISTLLVVVTIKLVFSKNLLENIIINSAFSLLICLSYLLMDAPDVAMTEAALSSCLGTCVYLSFLNRLKEYQSHSSYSGKAENTSLEQQNMLDSHLRRNDIFPSLIKLYKRFPVKISLSKLILPSILCLLFVIVLTWVGLDLPEYGSASSPVQSALTKYYIEHTLHEIGIPSFVAAILASYRGYDTLGETSVILLAGISVLLLLSSRTSKNA